MNVIEKNPYVIFEKLNSTLNREELQEIAWLINKIPGNENTINQDIAGNKTCD